MSVIETYGLTKIYQNNVVALSDVTLKVSDCKIFSLVGPNGAGKTTFLRILSTQLLPTRGSAYVLGHDVIKEADEIREKIAVMPQEAIPLLYNTPWELVFYYARLRGFSRERAKKAAIDILTKLDLMRFKDYPCAKLSGGYRHRTLLGMVLVANAELYFLDEPTIGLDPVIRRRTWSLIREITEEDGSRVIFTTHYMEEAEELAEAVAIINKGHILAKGPLRDILGELRHKYKVVIMGEGAKSDDVLDQLSSYDCVVGKEKVIVYLNSLEELHEIVTKLLGFGGKLNVSIKTTGLEDVFIKLVGGEYGEG